MMNKDVEYLQSVIQRRIDNLPSTYEGLYIEGSRDAYELVLQDIDQLDELETLTVPVDLGEWLQSRSIGDSGVYFSTIDSLFYYWDIESDTAVFNFISQNKKELIEVILGTRGYRVEKPLYHALIKGHELVHDYDIYWNYDKSNHDVFVSRLHPPHDNFTTEMTEQEWFKVGINDSNADFVKVEEVEE